MQVVVTNERFNEGIERKRMESYFTKVEDKNKKEKKGE